MHVRSTDAIGGLNAYTQRHHGTRGASESPGNHPPDRHHRHGPHRDRDDTPCGVGLVRQRCVRYLTRRITSLRRIPTRDRHHEPIASRRNGCDNARLVTVITENSSKGGHGRGEIALFDDGVWPHRSHDGLLVDEASRAVDEVQQKIESLGRQRNRMAVTQQQSLGGIKPERSELADGTVAERRGGPRTRPPDPRHRRPQNTAFSSGDILVHFWVHPGAVSHWQSNDHELEPSVQRRRRGGSGGRPLPPHRVAENDRTRKVGDAMLNQ